MSRLLCFVFFLSGAAALLFETLWFRLAGIALSNSVWAGAVVLAAFMAGLALGNAVAARHGHRVARPLVAYAALEVLVALTGTALVIVLPALGEWLVPLFRPLLERPWAIQSLRLAVAFGLLLVPAAAMGLTLPLLVRVLVGQDPRFGKALGALYGWNTLGAVAGALAGEMVLIEHLGVRGTGYAAAGLDLAAALGAVALARHLGTGSVSAATGLARRSPRVLRLLVATSVAGGILLALEVVWFRLLQLFVIGTSLTFAVMLASVLAGIGLGGLAASLWLARRPRAYAGLAPAALAAGCAAAWSYRLFPAPESTLAGTYDQGLAVAGLALALMLPVSFLSGVLFTWIGAATQAEVDLATRAAGWVTLANTLGATAGSLVGGFVLLPRLGVEQSLFVLALAYGLVAWAALPAAAGSRAANVTAALAFVLSLGLFPFGAWSVHLDAASRAYRERWQARTIAVREGLNETIQVLRRDFAGEALDYRLMTNGHSMSGTALDSRRYMKMYVWWPVAVHPGLKRALLIGYGVGTTAKALTDTRELERIDVVELSRDILELGARVYPDPRESPLADPRVHVHVGDGRYHLLATDRQYDLITSEPPPLAVAGAALLYSEEHFRLIRRRLAEGGYVTYWLPVQQIGADSVRAIVRGFCNAFEDCSLWAGCKYDFMLVGSRGAHGAVDPERFARQWRDPVVAPELASLGLELPQQLGATFIADAERLREIAGDARPLVDDFPKRLSFERATVEERELYTLWLDPVAAARRFERSALIRDRWPAPLREATLPYFRFQPIANMLVFPDDPRALEMIDTILEQTPLATAVSWLAGSSRDHERIAAARELEGVAGDFSRYLGARALADRDYETAARHFGHRPESHAEQAARLHGYALCKAGHAAQARAVGYPCP